MDGGRLRPFDTLLCRGLLALSQPGDVTQLLCELSGGNRSVLDELLPLVYGELKRIARRSLQGERPGHTLNTTALVHEAYLKLARVDRLTWKDRAHFFAVCAQAMRRVLVNYALMKKAGKRGAGAPHVPIEDVVAVARSRPGDILWVDETLDRLEALNGRHARIVECRVFGGMGVRETAEALDISPATVKRDWALARAWLNRQVEASS
jgi:RNA polymerase sigma factor (TIGR02999 family)